MRHHQPNHTSPVLSAEKKLPIFAYCQEIKNVWQGTLDFPALYITSSRTWWENAWQIYSSLYPFFAQMISNYSLNSCFSISNRNKDVFYLSYLCYVHVWNILPTLSVWTYFTYCIQIKTTILNISDLFISLSVLLWECNLFGTFRNFNLTESKL